MARRKTNTKATMYVGTCAPVKFSTIAEVFDEVEYILGESTVIMLLPFRRTQGKFETTIAFSVYVKTEGGSVKTGIRIHIEEGTL